MENNKFLCVFFRGSFDAWEASINSIDIFKDRLGQTDRTVFRAEEIRSFLTKDRCHGLTCRKALKRTAFFLRISNFGWSIASIFYSGLVHYRKHCCLTGLCVIPFFATKHQPKCFSTLVDLSNSSILMAGKSSNFAVNVWTNLDIKIFIMIVNVFNSTNVGSSSQVHTCMHMYIHACLHAYIYGYIPLHT